MKQTILSIILTLCCMLSLHAGDRMLKPYELYAKTFESLVSPLSYEGEVFEIDGLYYEILNGEEVAVKYVEDYEATEYAIPEKVQYQEVEYLVTRIGKSAFANNTELKKVVMPKTIKVIEDVAFGYCRSLSEVTLHDGIVDIGFSAFLNTAFTDVTLPASLENLGGLAFGGEKLQNINVTADNPYFKSIDGVLFSETLDKLVAYPSARTGEYTLPSHVETIGTCAFGSGSLSKIVVPDNVTAIEWGAFGYSGLLESVDLPKNLSRLEGSVFYACTELVSIELPITIVEVDYCMFGWCLNLKSVKLSENTTKIGDYAFEHCIKLTDIELTEGLTHIGNNSFDGCVAINTLELPCTLESIGNSGLRGIGVETLIVPELCVNIGSECFYGCQNLKNIVLPENLTEIPECTFSFCNSLLSIHFPDAVHTIGDRAFLGCISLKEIKWPNSLKVLDYYAFMRCSSLETVELPQTLQRIEGGCFQECSALTKVVFPDETPSLGSGIFQSCTSLEEVRLPRNLNSIPGGMFEECRSLSSINFNDGLKSIGNSAFYGCESLKDIEFPEFFSSIGSYAFENCTQLESLVFPLYVQEIERGAFFGCSSIKEVHAHQAFVRSTLKNAFDEVAPGATLHIPRAYIEYYSNWIPVFDNVEYTGLESVSLPESEITLSVGETKTLTPEYGYTGFTLIFDNKWTSSNPRVAEIAKDGQITALSEGETTVTIKACDIYYSECYAECRVTVTAASGIENVGADVIETEYFDLKGLRVNPDNLTPGVYIRRQGATTSKVVVK